MRQRVASREGADFLRTILKRTGAKDLVAATEINMLGIGDKFLHFSVVGVKPKFHFHEENGQSAFETLTEASFPGKWKVIFFYPKDFTFVCPTEIAEFARLNSEFADRDAVVLGGSTDNEHVKLAWRRDHKDLHKLPIWQFADTSGSLTDGLGVRSPDGVAYRVTFVVDPDNVDPARLRHQSQRRPRAQGHVARPRRLADRRIVRLRPRSRRRHPQGRLRRCRSKRSARGCPTSQGRPAQSFRARQ